MELAGTDNYARAKRDHQGWASELLDSGNRRDDKWSRSIAVGNREFVDTIKAKLGILAKGREAKETGTGYQLREPVNSYMSRFEAEKGDIGLENACFWDINI